MATPIDIAIEPRRDHVFAELADWRAFNVATAQMLSGLDDPGITTSSGAYLATFTYRASKDAAGEFQIELLHDDTDPAQRTFLFPTWPGEKVEIMAAPSAMVTVQEAARARRR